MAAKSFAGFPAERLYRQGHEHLLLQGLDQGEFIPRKKYQTEFIGREFDLHTILFGKYWQLPGKGKCESRRERHPVRLEAATTRQLHHTLDTAVNFSDIGNPADIQTVRERFGEKQFALFAQLLKLRKTIGRNRALEEQTLALYLIKLNC